MKFTSLFSGIGGFDLGFERAGMECVAQVEINADCQKLLGARWPNVKKYQDVRKVIGREQKSVDLICGGFPCQDLSVAGKRAGLDGERSGLWFEFHRIIANSLPRWVVIENVPGLLSSNAGQDFAVILRGLVECGYGVAWRILDAQYFGVAQRRRRVFIVGSLGDGRAAEILFEREGGTGNTPPRREAGERLATDVAGSIRHGGGKGRGYNFDAEAGLVAYKKRGGFGWSQSEQLSPTLESEGGTHQGGPERIPVIAFDWRAGDDSKWHTGENGKHKGGGAKEIVRQGDYSGAMNATRQDAVSGSFGVRRLTPVECERFQGFPDGWTKGFSDSVRYRMLGNAVAVPCAEWIGRRIVELSA